MMDFWHVGFFIGGLVTGAAILLAIWRFAIGDIRGNRRERRQERRDERGPIDG